MSTDDNYLSPEPGRSFSNGCMYKGSHRPSIASAGIVELEMRDDSPRGTEPVQRAGSSLDAPTPPPPPLAPPPAIVNTGTPPSAMKALKSPPVPPMSRKAVCFSPSASDPPIGAVEDSTSGDSDSSSDEPSFSHTIPRSGRERSSVQIALDRHGVGNSPTGADESDMKRAIAGGGIVSKAVNIAKAISAFVSIMRRDRLESEQSELEAIRLAAADEVQVVDGREEDVQRIRRVLHTAKDGSWMLLPDDEWRWYWDLVIHFIIVYYGIAVPVDFIYLHNRVSQKVIEAFLTILLVINMLLQFRTTFVRHGAINFSRTAITRHYLRGWFLIDLPSSLPLDLILFAIQQPSPGEKQSVALVVCSCLRFLMLLKVPHMFAESDSGSVTVQYVWFHYQFVPLFKNSTWLVLAIHWLTLVRVALVWDDPPVLQANGGGHDLEVPTGGGDYIVALYWVMYTVTTVGYGDISVNSNSQRAFAIVLFVLGAIMNGLVIGFLTTMLQHSDVHTERKNKMRETLAVLRFFKVPRVLTEEALAYQHHQLQNVITSGFHSVLQDFPDQLSEDITMYIKVKFVSLVPMFDIASDECRIALAKTLNSVFVPMHHHITTIGEEAKEMFFIAHGFAVMWDGQSERETIRKGSFFGEASLIINSVHTRTTVALTYCELFVLSKTAFWQIVDGFPEFKEYILQVVKEGEEREEERERKEADTPMSKKNDAGSANSDSQLCLQHGGENAKSMVSARTNNSTVNDFEGQLTRVNTDFSTNAETVIIPGSPRKPNEGSSTSVLAERLAERRGSGEGLTRKDSGTSIVSEQGLYARASSILEAMPSRTRVQTKRGERRTFITPRVRAAAASTQMSPMVNPRGGTRPPRSPLTVSTDTNHLLPHFTPPPTPSTNPPAPNAFLRESAPAAPTPVQPPERTTSSSSPKADPNYQKGHTAVPAKTRWNELAKRLKPRKGTEEALDKEVRRLMSSSSVRTSANAIPYPTDVAGDTPVTYEGLRTMLLSMQKNINDTVAETTGVILRQSNMLAERITAIESAFSMANNAENTTSDRSAYFTDRASSWRSMRSFGAPSFVRPRSHSVATDAYPKSPLRETPTHARSSRYTATDEPMLQHLPASSAFAANSPSKAPLMSTASSYPEQMPSPRQVEEATEDQMSSETTSPSTRPVQPAQ